MDNIESGGMDLERLLEEKEKLEGIIRDKFTKVVTVMFTDLKGSTAIAEKHGDLSSRSLIKDHNNIVFPLINDNGGVLVKSMGDGTLSYFPNALDALRAAVGIQRDFSAYNARKKLKEPVFIRVGMHTGSVIIEESDIFGDVVNTASRFESSANPGEIQLSEETYNALSDRDEITCRFIREAVLKGKKEPFRIYKAYWDPRELEEDLKKEEFRKAAAIDDETILVSRGTQAPAIPQSAGTGTPDTSISSDSLSATDEAGVLHKAEIYEKDKELVNLLLLLDKHSDLNAVKSILPGMYEDLNSGSPHDTKFFEDDALWFFKTSITTGRLQDADFPITNKAISRTPVTLGVRDGHGFLRMETKGSEMEIESGGGKQTVSPDTEYDLGQSGRIIVSSCFPVEYKVFKERFLVLKLTAVEDCVRTVMNLSLKDVWGNFEKESGRLIIIGQ